MKRRLAARPGANRDALLTRGLGRISVNGLLVAYATQANDVASDGGGRNSPFTSAFIKHVAAPDVDVRQMFFRVQDDVDRETAGRQRPELSISLVGEYKLKITITPVSPGEARPPAVQAPGIDPAERAWNAIRDTTSIAVIEEFLRHYDDSFYARFARARLEELKKSQVAVVAPPVPPPAPPTLVQPTVGVSPSATGAQSLTPTQERALKAKDSFKECDVCPEMVAVPAGSFTMGSPENESGRYDDEGPQHRVTIAKAFAVGKFEVTVDQFAAFVKDTNHDAGSTCREWITSSKWEERSGQSWRNPAYVQTGSHPVACINWNDAKAYAAWLSRKTGKDYRLLTEAEWEYAARAGSTSAYSFGDSNNGLCSYGNGTDQTAKRQVPGGSNWTIAPCDDGYAYTSPVGSFSANAFGLHDMHGNVWEWTEDCYKDNYAGAPTDGSASTSGNCSSRALRGGSWFNPPRALRTANRAGYTADYRAFHLGFRLARTLTP